MAKKDPTKNGMLNAIDLLIQAARAVKRYITDFARLRGDIKVWIEYPGEEKNLAYEKKNLIVRNGKTIMTRLLGGDLTYAGLRHISKIAFGTDSTPAVDTQTSLGAQRFMKDAVVSYPAFNQVRFTTTMESVEGGSHTYRELALISHTGNMMFSRVVIGSITKSTAYRIHVEWTISVQ